MCSNALAHAYFNSQPPESPTVATSQPSQPSEYSSISASQLPDEFPDVSTTPRGQRPQTVSTSNLSAFVSQQLQEQLLNVPTSQPQMVSTLQPKEPSMASASHPSSATSTLPLRSSVTDLLLFTRFECNEG